MSLPVSGFREAFPQFTEALFPDARVQFWLSLAEKTCSEARWEDLWAEGCYLQAAHNLTLERAAAKATDGTGGVDATAGPVVGVSKSAGGVSKSENRAGPTATASISAGHWNSTIYGQQYWQLVMLIGAGGTVV